MRTFKWLTVLGIILAVSQVHAKRYCYRCESLLSHACGDKFEDNKNGLIDFCAHDSLYCLKVVVKSPAESIVTRGCAVPNYCLEYASTSKECYTCESDYCNSSLRALSSSFGIVLGVVIVFMKFFLYL